MTSPYHLLNNTILDVDSHPEVKAILQFAEEVVESFKRDLQEAAETSQVYSNPFLLMAFDKLTLGDPALVHEKHISSTATKKVGRFFSLTDTLTAAEAVRVFAQPDDDVQVFLMMAIIGLRQIEIDGPSDLGNHQIDYPLHKLKLALTRSLRAAEAA